ncbi:MAG TPA: hypothetical protein VFN64_03850 [Burkholderiaceae bacterium]|nr:hypothetical protein [Burkholderiaceae bacterium]
MKPSEVLINDPTPQRVLIASRDELYEAVRVALRVGTRSVRVLHRDLSVFDLTSPEVIEALRRMVLGHRSARVRMLVDDAAWLESRAARLRLLQRRFAHALELRVASTEDPVGDDAWVLVDDHVSLELRPTSTASGNLWLHHKPHAQPLLAAFDRRWAAAGHNLPVSPLGLS